MATIDASSTGMDLYSGFFPFTSPLPGAPTPMFAGSVTYYKMQARCSGSASGYITWVNTSGDDAGKPACPGVLGATVEIARWSVST